MRHGAHDWWLIEDGPMDRPQLLLLHGAGGSGHSFRDLIPLLTPHYRVIVPDLPGQGCTRAGGMRRLGLEVMADDLTGLCAHLGGPPFAVIGHSAGAALALRMADLVPLRAVVGINAALGNFEGAAGVMFPLMAKLLAATPFVAAAASRLWGNASTVNRLLASTGSTLGPDGQAQYLRLVQDTDHVAGALGMMAQWRLEGVRQRLPQLEVPTLLIVGDRDKTVPARVSREAANRMPNAVYAEITGFGHLIHEESAAAVAAKILPFLERTRP
jgi:magnesium chelatase accessory protein